MLLATGFNRAKEIAQKLGFKDDKAQEQAADIMAKLYKLFKDTDATQVEINPLSETAEGVMWCVPACDRVRDRVPRRCDSLADVLPSSPSPRFLLPQHGRQVGL